MQVPNESVIRYLPASWQPGGGRGGGYNPVGVGKKEQELVRNQRPWSLQPQRKETKDLADPNSSKREKMHSQRGRNMGLWAVLFQSCLSGIIEIQEGLSEIANCSGRS